MINIHMAENIILEIGGNPANKGFSYIASAMEIFEEDKEFLYMITELYREIAKRHKTTAAGVERSIRYEKEEIMTHGDIENFQKYFPATQKKLPNGKFLAVLYLRLLQMRGESADAD